MYALYIAFICSRYNIQYPLMDTLYDKIIENNINLIQRILDGSYTLTINSDREVCSCKLKIYINIRLNVIASSVSSYTSLLFYIWVIKIMPFPICISSHLDYICHKLYVIYIELLCAFYLCIGLSIHPTNNKLSIIMFTLWGTISQKFLGSSYNSTKYFVYFIVSIYKSKLVNQSLI